MIKRHCYLTVTLSNGHAPAWLNAGMTSRWLSSCQCNRRSEGAGLSHLNDSPVFAMDEFRPKSPSVRLPVLFEISIKDDTGVFHLDTFGDERLAKAVQD